LEFQFSVRLMVLLMTKQLEKANSVGKFSAAFGNYLKFIYNEQNWKSTSTNTRRRGGQNH